MNRPLRIVLIRHGLSKRNEAKKGNTYFADEYSRSNIVGIPDHKIPLADHGWLQARITGEALVAMGQMFDYVYDSGYVRTEQTREGILEAYSPADRARMKIRHNLFIRERDSGHAYDMTEEEVAAAFPDLQRYWQTFGGFFARPPGGESIADVCNRVHTFLDTLFRDRAGQSILVITHGGTIRAFRYLLEHWDYDRAAHWAPEKPPENCSVTTYDFDRADQRLMLTAYNQVFWKRDLVKP